MNTKNVMKSMAMAIVMLNAASTAAEVEQVIEREMRAIAERDMAMLHECNECEVA